MYNKSKLLLLSTSLFLTPSLTPILASAPSYKVDSVELMKKKKNKKSKKEEGKKEVDEIKWEYVGARLKTKYEEIIKKH